MKSNDIDHDTSLAARLFAASVLAGIDLASIRMGTSKAIILAARIRQDTTLTESEARDLAALLLRRWK